MSCRLHLWFIMIIARVAERWAYNFLLSFFLSFFTHCLVDKTIWLIAIDPLSQLACRLSNLILLYCLSGFPFNRLSVLFTFLIVFLLFIDTNFFSLVVVLALVELPFLAGRVLSKMSSTCAHRCWLSQGCRAPSILFVATCKVLRKTTLYSSLSQDPPWHNQQRKENSLKNSFAIKVRKRKSSSLVGSESVFRVNFFIPQ